MVLNASCSRYLSFIMARLQVNPFLCFGNSSFFLSLGLGQKLSCIDPKIFLFVFLVSLEARTQAGDISSANVIHMSHFNPVSPAKPMGSQEK